eukprot:95998_1
MSRSIKLYISEEAKKKYKENKNLSSHIKISIEYIFIDKPSKAELEDDGVPKFLKAFAGVFSTRRKMLCLIKDCLNKKWNYVYMYIKQRIYRIWMYQDYQMHI